MLGNALVGIGTPTDHVEFICVSASWNRHIQREADFLPVAAGVVNTSANGDCTAAVPTGEDDTVAENGVQRAGDFQQQNFPRK